MKKKCLIFFMVLITAACSNKGSDNPTPPVVTVPSPAQASLTAPAQNAVCTAGSVLTDSTTSVTFSWNTSANTNTYGLAIENLLTNAITTQSTSATTLAVTLSRNTPYQWYVVSQSSKTTTTAQSSTWKFYVAGPGVVTYAPFPATITAPTFAQSVTASSGTINLTWTGSDVENAITGYDVYFGTGSTPVLFQSGITNMYLDNVNVSSGKTYYWRVITKDSFGNSSDSGVYQFSVN
jgi:hypothetical protein